MEFQVIVGGLGTVYVGRSRKRAVRSFRRQVERTLSRRVWTDSVTLFKDGEVWKEFDAGLVRFAVAQVC